MRPAVGLHALIVVAIATLSASSGCLFPAVVPDDVDAVGQELFRPAQNPPLRFVNVGYNDTEADTLEYSAYPPGNNVVAVSNRDDPIQQYTTTFQLPPRLVDFSVTLTWDHDQMDLDMAATLTQTRLIIQPGNATGTENEEMVWSDRNNDGSTGSPDHGATLASVPDDDLASQNWSVLEVTVYAKAAASVPFTIYVQATYKTLEALLEAPAEEAAGNE